MKEEVVTVSGLKETVNEMFSALDDTCITWKLINRVNCVTESIRELTDNVEMGELTDSVEMDTLKIKNQIEELQND